MVSKHQCRVLQNAFVILQAVLTFDSVAAQYPPNNIVMQPDDFRFHEMWTPTPHPPGVRAKTTRYDLPNIERLRTSGLQMMQACATTSHCGPSRFSTITGRYPSRSLFSRSNFADDPNVAWVLSESTKLQNEDCTDNNLAAFFQKNNYTTAVTGKWHLFPEWSETEEIVYQDFQSNLTQCGFDYAEALYYENLHGFWNDEQAFSHNLDYMAQKATTFLENQKDSSNPFFMYVNPTAPHTGGIEDALEMDCTITPEGQVTAFDVPEMFQGASDCRSYRDTLIARRPRSLKRKDKGDTERDHALGAMWVDDLVGALLQKLDDTNQLDNTLFIFQLDHGEEGKKTLYETGTRMAQFIHYPDVINSGSFPYPVSTIDIGPTLLDFAGFNETNSIGRYPMDGIS